VVGAAVEGADGDDVTLAVAGGGEQGGGERGHAAGERDGLGGAFELSEGGLEPGHSGVPEALVDGAAAGREGAAGGECLVVVTAAGHRGQRVGGGQVDRRDVDAEPGEVGAPGVYGCGVHGSHAGSVEHDDG